MSIDVDVFPTKPELIYWEDLKARWQALLEGSSDELLGKNPTCHILGTDEPVNNDSQLVVGAYYYFGLAIPNRLGLRVAFNSEVYTSERDYVEDYGRNLTVDVIEKYIELWKVLGYS